MVWIIIAYQMLMIQKRKTSPKGLFEKQIIFACNYNLPLMLHIRPSKKSQDAYEHAKYYANTIAMQCALL